MFLLCSLLNFGGWEFGHGIPGSLTLGLDEINEILVHKTLMCVCVFCRIKDQNVHVEGRKQKGS